MTLIVLSGNSLLMEAIKVGVEMHCPGFTVIGNCYTLEEGLEAIKTLMPDIILLDYDMLGLGKHENRLDTLYSNFKVIPMTSSIRKQKTLMAQGLQPVHAEPSDIVRLLGAIRGSGR